ncbi:hypothetical protein K7X08_016098 [Anisodus acutangulus]|uniref:Uncharacterized protein n=1 Tax=Anisodus acutangulus TaxID=402998 RepID=A0A9Q1LBG4_9SOLA|nr:hypothetical protein K7X08_016098 [Anisodus acutangulus]
MNRAAIEYEKNMHGTNLEYSQATEKHKITVTSEIEKLHAELANAERRARAAAPSNSNHLFAAATPSFTYSANYGNPERGCGGNLYPAPYAVHEVQGSTDASTQYVPGAMSYGSHGPYDMSKPYVHH